MSSETGRKIVDLLFKMYDEDDKLKPINKDTGGIILDFIGGEPLLETTLIKQIVNPPKIELTINLKIFLIGTIKILPIKKRKQIQAK